MNIWFYTAVSVFGIFDCILIKCILLRVWPKPKEAKDRKEFTKHNAADLALIIVCILCVGFLICLWSAVFPWMRPRIIVPGPYPRVYGLFS